MAQVCDRNITVVGSIPTRENVLLFINMVSRQSAAFSSTTQYAMSRKLGGEKECLNTRFPLPTLLLAGYSVMQKKSINID